MSTPQPPVDFLDGVHTISTHAWDDLTAARAPRAGQFEPIDPAPVTVWLIDTPDCAPYDALIRAYPSHQLYYSLPWRAALQREGYGEPYYLLAMRGGTAVGALPLFRIASRPDDPFKSLPASPLGGVLASDPAAAAALIDRAVQLTGQPPETFGERRFRPVPSGGPERLNATWLRLSVPVVVACFDTPPADELHSAEEDEDFHALLPPNGASHVRGIDQVLAQLAQANGHPGHLLEKDAGGHRAGMAVWLKSGPHAYLLGYRTGRCDRARHATLVAVARRLAAADVAWLDLRLPDEPDAWSRRLASLPETQIARSGR